jgi:hypothetical protein
LVIQLKVSYALQDHGLAWLELSLVTISVI